MTYADIIIMLKAGYTKEEIEALDQPEAPAAQPETQPADPAPEAPAEEQAPDTLPTVSTATPPDTLPTVSTATPPDPTQQILQQLTELVKSVQAQNRGAAEIRGNIIEPGAQAMDTLRSLGGIPAAPENK